MASISHVKVKYGRWHHSTWRWFHLVQPSLGRWHPSIKQLYHYSLTSLGWWYHHRSTGNDNCNKLNKIISTNFITNNFRLNIIENGSTLNHNKKKKKNLRDSLTNIYCVIFNKHHYDKVIINPQVKNKSIAHLLLFKKKNLQQAIKQDLILKANDKKWRKCNALLTNWTLGERDDWANEFLSKGDGTDR